MNNRSLEEAPARAVAANTVDEAFVRHFCGIFPTEISKPPGHDVSFNLHARVIFIHAEAAHS